MTMLLPLLLGQFLLLGCQGLADRQVATPADVISNQGMGLQTTPGTWAHFMQNLPETAEQVVDYRGNPIGSDKAFATLSYDVGARDLQQCADALIRLRAEYLFAQKRNTDIAFTFTSGHRYVFADYLAGKRPVVSGNAVSFSRTAAPQSASHKALRAYLDIVYTYAGTISLARDMQPAAGFDIGTVVVTPGSPGHCFIIADKKITGGQTRYKLVEGYTPAQTIYVLKADDGTPWHILPVAGEPIRTASYHFTDYRLRKWE